MAIHRKGQQIIGCISIVKNHTVPTHIMQDSTIRALERASLFFRNPYESDEAIFARQRPHFPRNHNIFNESKETWPVYGDERPTFTVYRAQDIPLSQPDDNDSIIQDVEPLTSSPYSSPFNPGRLQKARNFKRKIEKWRLENPRGKKVPVLGRVLLFPEATLTYSQVKSSDIHFWRSRFQDSKLKSQETHAPRITSESTDYSTAGGKYGLLPSIMSESSFSGGEEIIFSDLDNDVETGSLSRLHPETDMEMSDVVGGEGLGLKDKDATFWSSSFAFIRSSLARSLIRRGIIFLSSIG